MDAAALFDARKDDVAAFTALLFRRSAAPVGAIGLTKKIDGTRFQHVAGKRNDKPNEVAHDVEASFPSPSPSLPLYSVTTTTAAASAPSYRRPASANVPVSRVVREAKARAARQRRRAGQDAKKATPRTAASSSGASSLHALGFTEQEIRDRTYLWMSQRVDGANDEHDDTTENVARAASRASGVLTPQQQAQLRRLRIKRTHQHALPYSQWVLLLRRRRRLWQRRRPVARRRHLRRRLALQHGCALQPCACCSRKRSSKKQAKRRSAQKAAAAHVKVRASHTSQWLPSHSRLVKRFHHRLLALALPRSVTHATALHRSLSLKRRRAVLTARVSVPVEPTRKAHRVLQRWAAELGAQQRRVQAGAAAASALPTALSTTLLAEVSHQCVYTITRSAASSSSAHSTAPLTLEDVARVTGLCGASASSSSSCSPAYVFSSVLSAPRQRTRQSTATVLHGHMWGATEDRRAAASTRSGEAGRRRGRISTLARHTRVVPVALVACAAGEASNASFLLVSEAPVLIPRRASSVVRVQLISAWNPCCRCPAFASVYEYWRWAPWGVQSDTSRCLPPAVEAVRRVLQRTVRVHRRLKRRGRAAAARARRSVSRKIVSSKKKKKKAGARKAHAEKRSRSHSAAKGRRNGLPHVSLLVFPSLQPPFLHTPADPSGRVNTTYAWRVAFVYHRRERRQPDSTTMKKTAKKKESAKRARNRKAASPRPSLSLRQAYRSSVRARRAHFHLARRFFGFFLLSSKRATDKVTHTGKVSPPSVRTVTAPTRTRALGTADRATLLQLVGRPAYPADYGQSRPSVASQQRMRRRHAHHVPRRSLVARPGAKRSHEAVSLAEEGDEAMTDVLHPFTALPSYVHTIEYFGNATTAGCRLTVRSAHADKRLPALHGAVGSVLLRWYRRCPASTSPTTSASTRQGFSSEGVAVVERVGVVSSSPFFAQRFGCVVSAVWCCFPPPRASSAAPHQDGHWTANALLSRQQGDASAVYFVLAPPEAAATLLRRSAVLERPAPSRQRSSSRHQRAFDLSRGRIAREVAALLCDPTFCTPVQPIRWCE